MIHPNVGDVKKFSDSELEDKILQLNRYYHMTSNPEVQNQIVLLLDSYNIEREERELEKKKQQMQNPDDNSLDNLIKVS